jgi:hypothetical protein
MRYGRSEDEWDELAEAGLEFLVERARHGQLTSYTELNDALADRTGLARFDFARPDERAAMGHLLGLIVERNYPTTVLMISALVHYLGGNDAGPGFYALAVQLGLLPNDATRAAKDEFWVSQVAGVHRYYASSS